MLNSYQFLYIISSTLVSMQSASLDKIFFHVSVFGDVFQSGYDVYLGMVDPCQAVPDSSKPTFLSLRSSIQHPCTSTTPRHGRTEVTIPMANTIQTIAIASTKRIGVRENYIVANQPPAERMSAVYLETPLVGGSTSATLWEGL